MEKVNVKYPGEDVLMKLQEIEFNEGDDKRIDDMCVDLLEECQRKFSENDSTKHIQILYYDCFTNWSELAFSTDGKEKSYSFEIEATKHKGDFFEFKVFQTFGKEKKKLGTTYATARTGITEISTIICSHMIL